MASTPTSQMESPSQGCLCSWAQQPRGVDPHERRPTGTGGCTEVLRWDRHTHMPLPVAWQISIREAYVWTRVASACSSLGQPSLTDRLPHTSASVCSETSGPAVSVNGTPGLGTSRRTPPPAFCRTEAFLREFPILPLQGSREANKVRYA